MKTAQLHVITQPSNAEHDVLSKVLVVEHDPKVLAEIKPVFEACRLVGYRTTHENAPAILGATIDLGAVFLAEADSNGRDSFDLVEAIHVSRPDLPIFLRLLPKRSADDLPPQVAKYLTGIFTYGDYTQVRELIDKYLFSRHYPTEFVAEMKAMSLTVLRASFTDRHVEAEHPYIIKDKLIYGELFSLIPLESNWCRGYMTLQVEEEQVREIIHAKSASTNLDEQNFVHVNAVLGDISNMIWGSFKSRYGAKDYQTAPGYVRVEVPIVVNHLRKYISFGTDDAQLCFKFKISDPAGKVETSFIYQKFVFSLDWAPEKYAESNRCVNDLVKSGELDLF